MYRKHGLFIRLLFRFASLLLLLTFSAGCSKQPDAAAGSDPVVSLSFAPRHVMIDNQNAFVWKQVTIRLNNSYTYTAVILPRGPSSIPLSAFLDPYGVSFNPDTEKPHHLVIDIQQSFNGQPGRFIW